MNSKKLFDPRAKVVNPFVQAYVEKQTQRARPVGEAQSFVNVLLICGMVINFFVLVLVGWSFSHNSKPEKSDLTAYEGENLPLADAVSRIQQLESTLTTMQTTVEFHKNAYYKLEGDYENMKAAMARMQSGESGRNDLSAYPAAADASLARVQATPPVAVNDDEAPLLPTEHVHTPSDSKALTQQYATPRIRGQ